MPSCFGSPSRAARHTAPLKAPPRHPHTPSAHHRIRHPGPQARDPRIPARRSRAVGRQRLPTLRPRNERARHPKGAALLSAVGGEGFEPPKAKPTDLQSVLVDHLSIRPKCPHRGKSRLANLSRPGNPRRFEPETSAKSGHGDPNPPRSRSTHAMPRLQTTITGTVRSTAGSAPHRRNPRRRCRRGQPCNSGTRRNQAARRRCRRCPRCR